MINQSSQAVNPRHVVLTDTWYLQKKSLFSLKAEWINCRLRLTPPSASASQVLDKSYNELQDDHSIVVNYITSKQDSSKPTFTNEKQKSNYVQELLRDFQNVLTMQVGLEAMTKNEVTQILLLNQSMNLEHRLLEKDGEMKFFTLSVK